MQHNCEAGVLGWSLVSAYSQLAVYRVYKAHYISHLIPRTAQQTGTNLYYEWENDTQVRLSVSYCWQVIEMALQPTCGWATQAINRLTWLSFLGWRGGGYSISRFYNLPDPKNYLSSLLKTTKAQIPKTFPWSSQFSRQGAGKDFHYLIKTQERLYNEVSVGHCGPEELRRSLNNV